ncbi:hypothetical protein ARMSODRAFT_1004626 [Armillaria solidipes]|uniref:F-box domain-containing protein n=1 Tax=Armillaria solidipes TaxID=1076256 RepID=A0A2H3BD48_9AGAR|nr:hypothetical protein ARMSODRAFT_1004626 [Armillaria solidipes]
MNATDAMLHLDAAVRSAPEPLLPPSALNSQISGILRATRPFLDTDRDWILQNIEVLQQQISVYDALLDRVDEVKSELQHRRDAVHKSMAAYSSTLAPIRRLHSDILRAVFHEIQLSMWWNREESGPPKDHQALDFSQGPWKLGHVCGAWRDIVLSYPQLWSHLVLHFRAIHPTGTPHHTVLALKAMILRSAQHPIDIVFELDVDHDEYAAVQAFSVILDESYRWRSIHLQIFLTLLGRLKVVRGKIPCLESLTMKTSWIPYFSRQELPEDVRSAFIDAPRLQKVTLHHTHGLGDFMFPHHITHLAACVDNVSNLEGYQSLVECHLEAGQGPGPLHHIHLPNVRRLFVSSTRILTHLRLPSLDNLVVYGHDTPEVHTAVKMVNDFIYHSRCSLTRLATDSFVFTDQVFVKDCLSLMNTLVCLQIGLVWEVENIFNALASIGFLPNLQHLTLQLFSSIEPSFWDPFTAMISSRSQYLRSIRIFCFISNDVERVSERLTPLRPPGLQLIVSMRENNEGTSSLGNFQSG